VARAVAGLSEVANRLGSLNSVEPNSGIAIPVLAIDLRDLVTEFRHHRVQLPQLLTP